MPPYADSRSIVKFCMNKAQCKFEKNPSVALATAPLQGRLYTVAPLCYLQGRLSSAVGDIIP